jgi:hypothetical protein
MPPPSPLLGGGQGIQAMVSAPDVDDTIDDDG